MEAEEINTKIDELENEVKKLAKRKFREVLEEGLTIKETEHKLNNLNVEVRFIGVFENAIQYLFKRYKETTQIKYPIPEWLED